MCNYYCKFVKDYVKFLFFLNNFLRKDIKFYWIEECQLFFEIFKQFLIFFLILVYFDFSKSFIFICDVLFLVIGFVFGQLDSFGKEYVIVFGGRSFFFCERKWFIFE